MKKFEKDQVYHVYNQGNNRQLIFREDVNYDYFLKKMQKFVKPYAEFLSYCLMPNHFHFLLIPNELAGLDSKAIKPSAKNTTAIPQENLSFAIGTLLSSYTKGFNMKYGRSGSLFRQKTKVKNGWIDGLVTSEGSKKDLLFEPDNDYIIQCFHYIHENPVKANLVKSATDWIYSSARDYYGNRNGTLCNKQLAEEILGKENIYLI